MLQKIKRDENIVYLKKLINAFLLGLFLLVVTKNILIPLNTFPVLKLCLVMIVAIFCHLTLKKLYYTYWTFGLIFFALIFFDVLAAMWIKPWLGTIGFALLLGFLVTNYFIASPVYYPRVNWWEYDFRYRTDLKGKIILENGETIECRIADIRREAACIHSFVGFQTGTELNLAIEIEINTVKCTVKIISTRVGNPGRPSIYGVQFPHDALGAYQEIRQYWRQVARLKSDHKFKKVIDG